MGPRQKNTKPSGCSREASKHHQQQAASWQTFKIVRICTAHSWLELMTHAVHAQELDEDGAKAEEQEAIRLQREAAAQLQPEDYELSAGSSSEDDAEAEDTLGAAAGQVCFLELPIHGWHRGKTLLARDTGWPFSQSCQKTMSSAWAAALRAMQRLRTHWVLLLARCAALCWHELPFSDHAVSTQNMLYCVAAHVQAKHCHVLRLMSMLAGHVTGPAWNACMLCEQQHAAAAVPQAAYIARISECDRCQCLIKRAIHGPTGGHVSCHVDRSFTNSQI